jgi:hypothetical protein
LCAYLKGKIGKTEVEQKNKSLELPFELKVLRRAAKISSCGVVEILEED